MGFGYESSAKPVGTIKQPVSSRIKRKQWARSKHFSRAKSSQEWVFTPLELSTTLGDAVDFMARGSVPVHGSNLALCMRCLLPRGIRNESLSLSRGTGSDSDLTRALRVRLIPCTTLHWSLSDLSHTKFVLRERFIGAFFQNVIFICKLASCGSYESLFSSC